MYKELLDELFELEYDLELLRELLQEKEVLVKESYKSKYIDLVFEFYSSGYNFSQITEDVCDIYNNEDICGLMDGFGKFINHYARLLQFFTFSKLEEPKDLWKTFNYWKNKRLDIIEIKNTGD